MNNLPKGIHICGKGPAVVLLHSSLSSAKQWLPLVKCLKNDFTVINIDLLGYGSADKVENPESYSASIEINRIQMVLNTVIKNEPYHIVGHSCGGALGLKLAVESPNRVLSLSLYEPVAFHLLDDNSKATQSAAKLAKEINIADSYLAAEKFTDFWNEKNFFKSLPVFKQKLMADEMKKVNLDFVALRSEKYELKDVNKIIAPAMMMTGSKSPELIKTLTSMIVNSLHNIEELVFETGHMGPITLGNQVQPEIAAFIRKNNR